MPRSATSGPGRLSEPAGSTAHPAGRGMVCGFRTCKGPRTRKGSSGSRRFVSIPSSSHTGTAHHSLAADQRRATRLGSSRASSKWGWIRHNRANPHRFRSAVPAPSLGDQAQGRRACGGTEGPGANADDLGGILMNPRPCAVPRLPASRHSLLQQ
jgi:hypothetical protein